MIEGIERTRGGELALAALKPFQEHDEETIRIPGVDFRRDG